MKPRRFLIVLLCLAAILACSVTLAHAQAAREIRSADATAEMGRLLADLARAAEAPQAGDAQIIRGDLQAIRALNSEDYAIARSIAEHWQRVFLDPDYRLCLYDGGERAKELEGRGVPHGSAHAVVVLGYELNDGEMQPELKARCEAGAAVARSFPEAIVVCSGGATGPNNPERHTEAGLMRDYLTQVCGLDPERIFVDDYHDLTTAERGAQYTYGKYLFMYLYEQYGDGTYKMLNDKLIEKGIDYNRIEYGEEALKSFASAIKEAFGEDVFAKFGEWCVQNDHLQNVGEIITD